MKHALTRRFLQVVAVFSPLLCTEIFIFNTPGWSQTGPATSAATRANPFVPPTLSYASVFENYHGYQDQEVASWLEANETVGRLDGWRRHHLGEAAQSQQEPIPLTEDTRHHSGHGGQP